MIYDSLPHICNHNIDKRFLCAFSRKSQLFARANSANGLFKIIEYDEIIDMKSHLSFLIVLNYVSVNSGRVPKLQEFYNVRVQYLIRIVVLKSSFIHCSLQLFIFGVSLNKYRFASHKRIGVHPTAVTLSIRYLDNTGLYRKHEVAANEQWIYDFKTGIVPFVASQSNLAFI